MSIPGMTKIRRLVGKESDPAEFSHSAESLSFYGAPVSGAGSYPIVYTYIIGTRLTVLNNVRHVGC